MELIIILIICIIALLLVYFAFNISLKKLKGSIKNERIKQLVDKFPENDEICKSILKMLKNEKVKIKISENSRDKTSVYVVLTDSIFIANIKDAYTRIQTMAHECIHSVQNRRMLLFNFVFTNLYNLYFVVAIILTICRVYKNYYIQVSILLIMGIVFYAVRSYLENDAMIKAKYLAEDYMKEYNRKKNICTNEEIEEIAEEYDRSNKIGIPLYNFILFLKIISKIIIYLLISFVISII